MFNDLFVYEIEEVDELACFNAKRIFTHITHLPGDFYEHTNGVDMVQLIDSQVVAVIPKSKLLFSFDKF